MLVEDISTIEEKKKFLTEKLKTKVYLFITKENNYPEWKQLNVIEKQIGASVRHPFLKWKGDLLDAADVVETDISSAQTIEEVETAYNSMIYNLLQE